MSNRRRKRRAERRTSETARRRVAQEYQRNRDELMERTLLGMDDGTFEAALDESVDFEKFMDMFDEEAEEIKRRTALLEAPEPAALQMQKRHRERLPGLKISYK